LKDQYGIVATSVKRTISVHTLTSFEDQALMLPPHSPTLLLRLATEDSEGKPIKYMRSVNHPIHVNFQTLSPLTT